MKSKWTKNNKENQWNKDLGLWKDKINTFLTKLTKRYKENSIYIIMSEKGEIAIDTEEIQRNMRM